MTENIENITMDIEVKINSLMKIWNLFLHIWKTALISERVILSVRYNEVDIAEILEEIIEEKGIDKAIITFRTLPKDVSVEVFSYLPADDQVNIINSITDKEIYYIMKEMDFDDKIDALEELPANIVDKIFGPDPWRGAQTNQHLFELSGRLCGKPDDSSLHQPAGNDDRCSGT